MPALVCPNTVVKDLVIEFSSPSLCRSVRTKASNMNDHEAVIGKITPGLKSTLFRVLATVAAVIVLQACNSNGDDNGEIIGFSYVDELDNVYEPFQPELGAAVPVAARAALEAANLPYPPFNPHNIKSIGPSGWLNRNELVQAGVGDVIFNQLWSVWQPSPNLSQRDPNTFEYDNMVWRIDPVKEKQIRWYSSQGINVTAVLYGTPEWARRTNTSRVANVPLIHPGFIAPDDPNDYARYVGMIARRYNGANGNGRIVNFIIQNEINAIDWFNPGCGESDHPCEIEDRIQSYAEIYNKAYDRIKQEQPEAKVFMSFDHHFGKPFYDQERFASAQQFIDRLAPLVEPREWRLAFHSYPSDLFKPEFGPHDYPKVTFGNLGVLAGYLRQRFPDKPHAWEIHLTENGINSSEPRSSRDAQNQQLPVALRNVLGTPGINNFVYHRIQDHENEGTFKPGLHDINAQPKPAWFTWTGNNRHRQNSPQLSGGYEDLPYVRLSRYVNPDTGHWASTRQAPAGYQREAEYLLLREPLPNTTVLYECFVASKNVTRITPDVNCEGAQNFGPVGYSFNFNNQSGSRAGLFSIETPAGDHVLSTNSEEVRGLVTLLGFIDTSKVLQQPLPQRDLSFYDTRHGPNTAPAAIASQPAAEQVINAVGDCSETELSCSFLRFIVAENQSHELSCRFQGQDVPNADIVLNYGTNTFSRSVEVPHVVNPENNRYSIHLPVGNDANWASVILTSTDGATTNHCYVVQSGTLSIGAAEETQSLSSNLLQNGGFENVLTDWELCTGDSASIFSNDAHLGAQSIQIGDGNCVYQEVIADPGVEYDLNCFARHNGPGVGSLKLGFANGSFQKLAEKELPVNVDFYEPYTISTVAPEGSVYAVVTFASGVGTGLLDTCSLSAGE